MQLQDPRDLIMGKIFHQREHVLEMSVEDLAKTLGVQERDIIAWEGGFPDGGIEWERVPWEMIPRIATALGMTELELMGIEDAAPEPMPALKRRGKEAQDRARIVGQAIRWMREFKHMSRDDLAGAVGTTYQSIYQWETGRAFPPKWRHRALCEALGCTEEALRLK